MLINIFKIVFKDENEEDKKLMVVIYPQGGYIDKRSSFLSTKQQQFRAEKIFSILCFAQQLVIEPEGVLNSYKEKIKCVINEESLDAADYAIYKNITKFTYIEADDIESEKGLLRRDMRGMDKYFETDEFHEFKKNHLRKNLKDYQIPQGSSISAVYANVYMIDFDKKINDFITSQKGMYRRYCDDIIIAVPMTQEDVKGKNEEIAKFIYSTRDGIPNLELNEDKTEHFFYDNGIIEKIKGKSNLINYLGFTFDGKTVRIRDKSLFKCIR